MQNYVSMKTFTPLLLLLISYSLSAQPTPIAPDGGGAYRINENATPCISPEQYKMIEQQLQQSASKYPIANPYRAAMSYSWPLKPAPSITDCSYYFISAHVDQDTMPTTFKDYNCGTIVYDGHKGTDIALWPFPFYKMDNNQVEVIAAAPGTIYNKVDGNFDKNCAANSNPANYIAIQHADGSIAIYYHMKKNSLTSKTIGQSIATGEYLGMVGSSGSSSGPHLHFEVWSGATVSTRKDPFAGTCNTLNATTLWASQKPYTEPVVIAVVVGKVAPVIPACPATETPNEDSCFTTGTAVFSIFTRNETNGTSISLRIINPNNTIYSSWTHTCSITAPAAGWNWTRPLPVVAGTYTFEANYNGVICSKKFRVNCGVSDISETDNHSIASIYPNPSTGKFVIEVANGEQPKQGEFELYNVEGGLVYHSKMATTASSTVIRQEFDLNVPNGFYFYKVKDGLHFIASGKLLIQ